MTPDLWQWSATETAAAIRNGRISAVDAVEAALQRMQAVNVRVNAVTLDLSDTARVQARRADEAQSAGLALGPLHGVPVTIKENVDQAGLSNPNGLPAFESVVASENSPVVDNLLHAGAIVIGRTNTPEFSFRWFTDNPLRGKTFNPWNDGVTPGGSSGGAAAAVALGIGAIGHGNDLGGSLRYPAYACGLATIRPSLGRVPAFNPSATDDRPLTLQLMSVQGPIAREVRDVRLALAAMARGDARDPWWVPAPLEGPRLAAPLRVAVTKDPGGIPCDPAVAAAIDAAAGYLSDAGYAVEAVDPPLVAELAENWRTVLFAETGVMMEAAVREHGSADINAVYDGYLSTVGTATLQSHVRAMARRTRFLRAWSVFMEDFPLVLAPVSQVPPFPQDEDLRGVDRVARMLGEQSMLYGVNLLGLPAASVPTGLHDVSKSNVSKSNVSNNGAADSGVPLGVQIIGRRFREDLCLDAAQTIENRVGVLAQRLWARG